MPNKVELRDGFIRIIYGGKQTVETIDGLITAVSPLISELRREGQPVLLLVDIGNIGELTPSARLRAVKFIKEADYDKVATFGGSPFMKAMNNLMMKAAGQGKRLAYFDTEQEAARWLKK